jgi:CxxC motif-containing protein (DUF1111 family)
MKSWLPVLPLAAAALSSCHRGADPATDIFGDLGDPLPAATPEQKATFERGRKVALRRFTEADGLGPRFSLSFCGGCHERPVTGGGSARYRDFLLVRQTLPDGSQVNTGVNGVQPQYLTEGGYDPTDPQTNLYAARHPIPFFGVGLLAEVTEEAILANADPDDADGDGISGRPNYDRGFVGRFGRKAQTVSIEGFIRGPLFNHLGVTSNPLPNARKNQLPVPSGTPETTATTSAALTRERLGEAAQAQAAAPDEPTVDDDGVPDPELSEDDLFDLVSFAMLQAAPRPDAADAQTERGSALFTKVNCTGCHVPSLEGPRGLIPAYTDLLLHDMGPDLADGVRFGEATGVEFRTQPLWGVVAVGPYLHDGRADTLDQSIRLHGGEGEKSRRAYEALTDAERTDVIAFISSLGGSKQRSDGMIPPGTPVPAVGAYGGPDQELSAADAERFQRGRAAFDRDRPLEEGLGPRYNGDSCRACHFDPVPGGSGPADVNVVRQGIVGPDGFQAPAMGTMVHRHMVNSKDRPPVDPAANVFEVRQTPTALGLGLLDGIADAAILANADPDDTDGDGIRGIARVLPDGRLGKLGWKCGVPSVAEFARDAMFNELGVTLPDQPGLTFGSGHDDDAWPDPEITAAELGDLVFFLQHLGPPPRTSTDVTLEKKGEPLFAQVGCDRCHVPTLPTTAGGSVRLYSDLLLHDVAPAGVVGIADGPASMRHFRTTPLWGIARSAPYMHHGRAGTIEDAIAMHEAEGAASVTAFQALSASDRAALLAFLGSL